MNVCTCECRYPTVPEEGFRPPGARDIGNFEAPYMYARMELRSSTRAEHTLK